jgi:hypothetical protein
LTVEVYRNLNRKGLWFSFRDKKTKLVCDRIDLKANEWRTLNGVSFKVSKAGQARVRREHRKNVHALITGDVMPLFFTARKVLEKHPNLKPWKVKYDPYTNDCFIGVAANGMTIKLKHAVYVTFDENGVTAWTV